MNENYEWHIAHCAFCGKGVFWALFLGRIVQLRNGWSAHKQCYGNYEKQRETNESSVEC
jgi:hypothetical protein